MSAFFPLSATIPVTLRVPGVWWTNADPEVRPVADVRRVDDVDDRDDVAVRPTSIQREERREQPEGQQRRRGRRGAAGCTAVHSRTEPHGLMRSDSGDASLTPAEFAANARQR